MTAFDGARVLDDLIATSTVLDRFDALTNGLANLGLTAVNYGVFGPFVEGGADSDIGFLTTMSDEWMGYYYSAGLASRDSHVQRLHTGKVSPYIWGESVFGHLGASELKTAREGAEAGLRSSLCVPFVGPGAGLAPIGAINLGSSLPETEFRKIFAEHGSTLIQLANVFHGASVRQAWGHRSGVSPLSARERDCLQYLSLGQRHKAVAQTLGLATITVELHLRRARQKLGARTLSEAIARGFLFGELTYG